MCSVACAPRQMSHCAPLPKLHYAYCTHFCTRNSSRLCYALLSRLFSFSGRRMRHLFSPYLHLHPDVIRSGMHLRFKRLFNSHAEHKQQPIRNAHCDHCNDDYYSFNMDRYVYQTAKVPRYTGQAFRFLIYRKTFTSHRSQRTRIQNVSSKLAARNFNTSSEVPSAPFPVNVNLDFMERVQSDRFLDAGLRAAASSRSAQGIAQRRSSDRDLLSSGASTVVQRSRATAAVRAGRSKDQLAAAQQGMRAAETR